MNIWADEVSVNVRAGIIAEELWLTSRLPRRGERMPDCLPSSVRWPSEIWSSRRSDPR